MRADFQAERMSQQQQPDKPLRLENKHDAEPLCFIPLRTFFVKRPFTDFDIVAKAPLIR
jgi:hypothetical protein